MDPYFHNYSQYIKERRQAGQSTSRRDYFYDILMDLGETERIQVLRSILDDVRESVPDKVSGLEEEFQAGQLIEPSKHAAIDDTSSESAAKSEQTDVLRTRMYHELHAPKGKIFDASEVPRLEAAGWFDSPAKFGTTSRSTTTRFTRKIRKFWYAQWKWIIGTIIAIIALIMK